MKHTVPPMEVVKQVQCRRNASTEVNEKMCDHNHIGLSPDDAFGPANIGINDPFSEKWVLDVG